MEPLGTSLRLLVFSFDLGLGMGSGMLAAYRQTALAELQVINRAEPFAKPLGGSWRPSKILAIPYKYSQQRSALKPRAFAQT